MTSTLLSRRLAPLLLLFTLFVGCTHAPAPPVPPRAEAATATAALAMPDAFSAAAAEAVLRDGGNAVDASIAAAFVLAVTYPEAGNVGGGGFMVAQMAGQAYFLDYRETGPHRATADLFLDQDGEVIPDASLVGHLAVGVPGTVAGLWAAHQRLGTLPWRRLVEPAIELARDGFVMPAQLVDRIGEEREAFVGRTNFDAYFAHAVPGQRFVQPELAATLQRVAADGSAGFYAGETARLIAQQMRRGGGLIDEQDLADYRALWREPLRSRWRDYTLIGAAPPSSGGFAVFQLLAMKDELAPLFAGLAHNSPQYVHLVAEMEKRVFADRAEYFGDPDVVDVPIAPLLAPAYIRRRAAEVNPTAISPLSAARPGLEGRHTTHFSVLDFDGNAVANTYTLNTWFGSGVVVTGGGFLLNNEMDDFSAKPGVANVYGVSGRSANAVGPGKRMLSSMSPTIALRDGLVAGVVGTPGGSTIPTSVFQCIVNVEDFGMTPQQAVGATRFHHQLDPPELVTYSPLRPLPDATIDALARRGYRVEPHSWSFGDVQMIWRRGERYETGSDPRGRGVSRVLGR